MSTKFLKVQLHTGVVLSLSKITYWCSAWIAHTVVIGPHVEALHTHTDS